MESYVVLAVLRKVARNDKTHEPPKSKTTLLLYDPEIGPGDVDSRFSAVSTEEIGCKYKLVDWETFERVTQSAYPTIFQLVSENMDHQKWVNRTIPGSLTNLSFLDAESLSNIFDSFEDT